MLKDSTSPRYKVGQVWRYHTRSHEETSTLTIVKIERHISLGIIVHVSLKGLRIRHPSHPSVSVDTVGHMPFSEEAMDQSVTALAQEYAPLPDFYEGYQQWRQAIEEGQAGVFTITVAESVDFMEQALGGPNRN